MKKTLLLAFVILVFSCQSRKMENKDLIRNWKLIDVQCPALDSIVALKEFENDDSKNNKQIETKLIFEKIH